MQQVRSAGGSNLARTSPASPVIGSGLEEIAHDACSLTTALGLYCDLLAEPGVLAEGHRHFLDELRLVSAATRRLTEKLGAVSGGAASSGDSQSEALRPISRASHASGERVEPLPALPIEDVAEELQAIRPLLAAVAGAGVSVELRIACGQVAVGLTAEDLIRVLLNLVKNAAEAMPEGGAIVIALNERKRPEHRVFVAVEDNGPGVPEDLRERVFEPRFTTKPTDDGSSRAHRGLGLSIARSIVEAAGGGIRAGVRPGGGARFQLELPVRRP